MKAINSYKSWYCISKLYISSLFWDNMATSYRRINIRALLTSFIWCLFLFLCTTFVSTYKIYFKWCLNEEILHMMTWKPFDWVEYSLTNMILNIMTKCYKIIYTYMYIKCKRTILFSDYYISLLRFKKSNAFSFFLHRLP